MVGWHHQLNGHESEETPGDSEGQGSLAGCSSVQFSRSVVSNPLRPHGLQHVRPPCPSPTPRVYLKLMSIESVMPSNHLILCHPLILLPSIFPSTRVFSNESVLHISWPKDWSFSFSISPSNDYLGLISFRMGWLDLFAVHSPRDSQESSPTPHFKSINTSALSFLYGPTLTSTHDYWKNHILDQTDLCWQSNVSAF